MLSIPTVIVPIPLRRESQHNHWYVIIKIQCRKATELIIWCCKYPWTKMTTLHQMARLLTIIIYQLQFTAGYGPRVMCAISPGLSHPFPGSLSLKQNKTMKFLNLSNFMFIASLMITPVYSIYCRPFVLIFEPHYLDILL